MTEPPIIAMTMGDAAGVGPEVIMKILGHFELHAQCRPLVIGDSERLIQAGRIVGSDLEVRSLSVEEGQGEISGRDGGLHRSEADSEWAAVGEALGVAGDAAYRYVEVAARLAMDRQVAAICTAPLNKEALQAGGHHFPGHTELLAALTGTEEVSMMLSTPKMRVIHVTTHIGLIDAIAKMSRDWWNARLRADMRRW